VNGVALEPGDAVQANGTERIVLDAGAAAEVLLFDLP